MKIWILIHTSKGIIDEPEIFYNLSSANKRKDSLSKVINPDYEEVEVFEKEITL